MTVFYLIRHAHAVWTPDEQRPLSLQGRADARRVAELLRRYPITQVYASPYRRAWETVAPLAEAMGLPVHEAPDLRERKLSGEPVDDFFAAVKRTWDDPTIAHPGGETNTAAQRRGVGVVQRLRAQHPTAHIALATHGNLLALVLHHYDPHVDYEFWRALTMPDIYTLELSNGEVTITRLWEAN
ncbi:MAG: histidine phosphatase family protein [Chloroflexi bacterium]|jgi:2,3-bisphosphoglycerate-dependent phosphoglycerate mutase|nr:histidine phosphatase family protein [Chloroflexota bacterium]